MRLASAHHRSSIDQITKEPDAPVCEAAAHSVRRNAKIDAFDLTACRCTALEYFNGYRKDRALDVWISNVKCGRAIAG
jgi:hypothetical protein